MLNYIKSYCHILANLPGILARLERELQSKPSAMSVAANSAAINSLEYRVANKPTQADLTALHSLMGGRLDKLEAQVGSQVSTANLRQDIRSSIANAVANVEAAKLNAEKTGEPNLYVGMDMSAKDGSTTIATISANIDPTETIAFVDDLRDQVMNGKMTPNQAREALGKAPMPKMDSKVTKARKPRAPKGGGK